MTDTMTLSWVATLPPSALDEHGVARANANGLNVALYVVDGEYFATADLCTHGQASLSDGYLDGELIECPLHQGKFDVRDGKPTCAPVTEAIRSYPVKIDAGRVFLSLD